MSLEAIDSGEDLISVLPDYVLDEIVTRLPTVDAVRVQVLSTRWRHMWRSSPLNLDLVWTMYRDDYDRVVPSILAAHAGPGRRVVVGWPYTLGEWYSSWLWSPALKGLQELEIDPGYPSKWVNQRALPERALFHFAATLRLLRIGYHAFPTAAAVAVAALRLPHLEVISLYCVHISEGTLHWVLAGCPMLKTLVLDGCTGFAAVRINSPTITSFAISPADKYRTWNNNLTAATAATTTTWQWQVIIEDAPLLERLVPFRSRWETTESFQLRVVSAPRLRVLGSLSSAIPRLEIGGGTVFEAATRRVCRVTKPDNIIVEKRSLMQAVMLATTLTTVKILALEDVDKWIPLMSSATT